MQGLHCGPRGARGASGLAFPANLAASAAGATRSARRATHRARRATRRHGARAGLQPQAGTREPTQQELRTRAQRRAAPRRGQRRQRPRPCLRLKRDRPRADPARLGTNAPMERLSTRAAHIRRRGWARQRHGRPAQQPGGPVRGARPAKARARCGSRTGCMAQQQPAAAARSEAAGRATAGLTADRGVHTLKRGAEPAAAALGKAFAPGTGCRAARRVAPCRAALYRTAPLFASSLRRGAAPLWAGLLNSTQRAACVSRHSGR